MSLVEGDFKETKKEFVPVSAYPLAACLGLASPSRADYDPFCYIMYLFVPFAAVVSLVLIPVDLIRLRVRITGFLLQFVYHRIWRRFKRP